MKLVQDVFSQMLGCPKRLAKQAVDLTQFYLHRLLERDYIYKGSLVSNLINLYTSLLLLLADNNGAVCPTLTDATT